MSKSFYIPIAMLCIFFGLLTGCKEQEVAKLSAPSTTTSSATTAVTTTGTISTTKPPELPSENLLTPPEGATRLTVAELDWFNTQFFNRNSREHMENLFLTSFYSKPSEIDLYSLFYNGMDSDISTEEVASLESVQSDFAQFDIAKTTISQMDQTLQEYMGLSLADTNKVGLDLFVYLPNYSAYYVSRGDTNWESYTMEDGYRSADGNVVLLYRLSYPINGREYSTVTLMLRDEGKYWFLSNQVYTN